MSVDAKPEIRLYVAGASPQSCRAIRLLRRWLAHLNIESTKCEVVDVYANPALAIADGVVAAPALISGRRKIIGEALLRGPESPA